MAGGGLSPAERRFEAESAGAPAPLRERSAGYLTRITAAEPAAALARAATDALAVVLSQPGDRSVALDLLAADALLTLALKTRAEQDPASLARFAAELRQSGGAAQGDAPAAR